MTYATDGKIGVNLAQTTTGTTTDGADAQRKLGERTAASDSSEWVYVQAGGAITQYDAVAIDENFQAVALTSALALAGHNIGFAQVAFADNAFGWVATHAAGNITCRYAGSCAKDVQLYTSATAGVLDDTSAGVLIRGVVCITTNATTVAGSSEIIAQHPSGAATP